MRKKVKQRENKRVKQWHTKKKGEIVQLEIQPGSSTGAYKNK